MKAQITASTEVSSNVILQDKVLANAEVNPIAEVTANPKANVQDEVIAQEKAEAISNANVSYQQEIAVQTEVTAHAEVPVQNTVQTCVFLYNRNLKRMVRNNKTIKKYKPNLF